MKSKKNYALEVKMLMKTDLKKESRCWQGTMLKASKANKAEVSERRSRQKIKEEEASWETTSRLEYVITGFAAW